MSGIGAFIQTAGPAVEQGYIPVEAAKSLLMTAVRRFKLGREVEDALDMVGEEEGEDQQPDPQMTQMHEQMQQQMQQMGEQLQQITQENQALKASTEGEQAKLSMEGQKALKAAEQKDRELSIKEFEAQKPEADETVKIQAEMTMARERMQFEAMEADKQRQVEGYHCQI